jgi:hypothetical protein
MIYITTLPVAYKAICTGINECLGYALAHRVGVKLGPFGVAGVRQGIAHEGRNP